MVCLVYAGILGVSIQSRISCHSVLRNFLVTSLSFGPPVIQMLLLSVWSLLFLISLSFDSTFHIHFCYLNFELFQKSSFFSSECFSFGCVLSLFQSCITLRKIVIFLKFSFVCPPCLGFSWAPSLKVFVSVSVSHLEAFLKYLVIVAVFHI